MSVRIAGRGTNIAIQQVRTNIKYLFTWMLPLQRDGVRHLNLMEFLQNDGDIDFD